MTPRRRGLAAIGAAHAVAFALSGCAIFSPVQTDEQYIQADGVPLTITNVEFENLVVITQAKGAPGVLVGQAVNQTRDAIPVTFGILGGSDPVTVSIAPAAGDGITAIPSNVDLGPVPVIPGAMVDVEISTPASGKSIVGVPVLPPDRDGADYYEGIAPGPTP